MTSLPTDGRTLDLDTYRALLVYLSAQGYSFPTFDEFHVDEPAARIALLRHDLDFSLEHAIPVAALEAELGIRSTYFIQVRSPLYNIASQRSQEILRHLQLLGHRLGLHSHVAPVDDPVNIVARDAEMVRLSGVEALLQVVSFHRMRQPLEQLKMLQVPPGWTHTYQPRYTTLLEYLSDSTGRWCHGWPDRSAGFANGRGLQILTHPLWWVVEGATPVEKLLRLSHDAPDRMITDLEQTAVSFPLR